MKTEIKIRFCTVRDDDGFLCDVQNPPDGGYIVYPPRRDALLTNVHYAAAAHKYTCRVCMYPDAVRPIHFAIRLYYIARFTPRIESHDPLLPTPPRVRSDSDTCKVYLPVCLPTWMTRYLRMRKGRGEGSKREMVVWAQCSRLVP